MKRIVYIISDTHKSLEFEWTISNLQAKFDLHVILIGEKETELKRFLLSKKIPTHFISDQEYVGWFSKLRRSVSLLSQLKPHTIHCHLWRASLIGLTTGWLLRISQRVFTRHHSMLHYHEYPSGRKWDRLCNFLATHIVAISQNVKNVLINYDRADEGKIMVIHHGFDLEYFQTVDSKLVDEIRQKYQINRRPVVGVISRYLELKGIQFIIPAFKELLNEYPEALLVLANANGPYSRAIKKHLSQLPTDSFREIVFESNLAALYKTFDLYIHVPIDSEREAFGQTYVEALASGVPSIFTLSGVAPEFLHDGQQALVVPFQNAEAITKACMRILTDKNLSATLQAKGLQAVQQFRLQNLIAELEKLYAS